jgi:GxxExxY protein
MKDEYPHRELSAAIIGAAMKVLNGLRPGLDEKIYKNSLVLELIAQGHQVEQSRMLFGVHYRGHLVGTLIPDILVDEKVIVDPKVVEAFTDNHIAQMLGYLAISGLELALLLNFKFAKLSWKRVVRSRSADEP